MAPGLARGRGDERPGECQDLRVLQRFDPGAELGVEHVDEDLGQQPLADGPRMPDVGQEEVVEVVRRLAAIEPPAVCATMKLPSHSVDRPMRSRPKKK